MSPCRVRRSFYRPLCICHASGHLIPESAWLLRRWMHSRTCNMLCTRYFTQNFIHLRIRISADETHTHPHNTRTHTHPHNTHAHTHTHIHISNRNYALVSKHSNTRLRERGTSREIAKNLSGQFFAGQVCDPPDVNHMPWPIWFHIT